MMRTLREDEGKVNEPNCMLVRSFIRTYRKSNTYSFDGVASPNELDDYDVQRNVNHMCGSLRESRQMLADLRNRPETRRGGRNHDDC
jgi:hypothetical protein